MDQAMFLVQGLYKLRRKGESPGYRHWVMENSVYWPRTAEDIRCWFLCAYNLLLSLLDNYHSYHRVPNFLEPTN